MTWAALSWMDDPRFAAAALPLLAAGEVDALEWSFDTAWSPRAATASVLDAFAGQGRLVGHGVTLSVLSARWTPRQEAWMGRLAAETRRRAYRHISEHLGFVTAGDRVDGAPLPMPLRDEVVAIGVDRLRRLSAESGLAVGLENLALALGRSDVDDEAELLERLLDPVDGFLVLDLHNLWCRALNFGCSLASLIDRYPLERVREVHLSGGSDVDGLRRDTHDGDVPQELFVALEALLPRCPSLELVVLERLPTGLETEGAAEAMRADFRRVREVLGARG